jgi:hypothetical protein
MVDGFPVHSRALEDGDGAPLLGEPSPQGQKLVVRGAKVPPLRANLPVGIHPAQTRRQLRRMAINPTTHGVNHLHDIDLLAGGDDNGGDVSAPALRCIFPTRDRIVSTGRGAASGTNRFLFGLKALRI